MSFRGQIGSVSLVSGGNSVHIGVSLTKEVDTAPDRVSRGTLPGNEHHCKVLDAGSRTADRDAVGASPPGAVGSDGWAEGSSRRAGLPVSRPGRLVLDALRGRGPAGNCTGPALAAQVRQSCGLSPSERSGVEHCLSHPGDPGRPQTGALLSLRRTDGLPSLCTTSPRSPRVSVLRTRPGTCL